MKFLPSDQFTIETKLNPDEVRAAIDENIVYDSFGYMSGNVSDFQGFTLDGSFDVDLIGYQNRKVIEIKGEIIAAGKGSIINANVQLSFYQKVCRIGLLCFLGLGALINILGMIKGHYLDIKIIAGLTLFIGGILSFLSWVFRKNTRTAKEKLANILNGAILSEV
jgi:hypothetical protein